MLTQKSDATIKIRSRSIPNTVNPLFIIIKLAWELRASRGNSGNNTLNTRDLENPLLPVAAWRRFSRARLTFLGKRSTKTPNQRGPDMATVLVRLWSCSGRGCTTEYGVYGVRTEEEWRMVMVSIVCIVHPLNTFVVNGP